jgi:ABC-type antimicrobial peptide transport system permease subunit
LQKLSGKQARVTQVLVKVNKASDVDKVAAEIQAALPGAQVVTTKSLASQVTGSLADAKKLASRLGGALGIIVLVAAFAIAVLLTLSSVAKRVREIGTLRAIGWSKGRVVRQVLAETIGIGLLGGIAGVAVGFAAAAAVGAFSPALTASTTGVPTFGSSSVSGLLGIQSTAATSSTVTLHAPVHLTTLLLGVAFAVIGGLIAGTIGGWRAARLAPAEALRNVG